MSNHTHGPWRVSNGKVTKEIQVWSHVKRIADCSVSKSLGYPEVKANAQLIAAAPDLLAAAKAVTAVIEMFADELRIKESADGIYRQSADAFRKLDDLRAAIAKAER